MQVEKEVQTVVKNVYPGLALNYLCKFVRSHFNDEKSRRNKLPVRLIGQQAIRLAQYYYRLVDALRMEEECEEEKIMRLALGKIGQCLRNASSIFNKFTVDNSDVNLLEEYLSQYYNLHVLFFKSSTNLSVWTMGCAVPYHARKLYDAMKVGYGIVSCQSKESKHAGIKKDLALTNRQSGNTESNNKWLQVFRAEYIRCFYIPEHCPTPLVHKSNFTPRVPPHCSKDDVCDCGREIVSEESSSCRTCLESSELMQCAKEGELTNHLFKILHPVICVHCKERFSDRTILEHHIKRTHRHNARILTSDPANMNRAALTTALRERGLDTRGNINTLRARLCAETF